MLLHEQLRKARTDASLSQARLAKHTGLSRNQIVRAETGQNITIETLRRIVDHLPIEALPLTDRVTLRVATVNPAERLLSDLAKIQAVLHRATSSTLDLAVGAHEVLRLARQAAAEESGQQPPSEERTRLLLERVALLLRGWSWIASVVFQK